MKNLKTKVELTKRQKLKLAKDKTKGFEVWHPNAYGHKLWAEYLINYIDKNNLLSWTQ